MHILFLTTELPWPLDGGGKARTFETLACLSSFAEVRVLSVVEHDSHADQQALAAALPGIAVEEATQHPIHIRRQPQALARVALMELVHFQPYLVAKFSNRSYVARAEALAAAEQPDLIWCDHLSMFPAALAARKAAGGSPGLVLDAHNVESDLFQDGAGTGGLLRVLAFVEGLRVARYEAKALRMADQVIAISSNDARRLAGLGAAERVRPVLPSVGEIPQELVPPEEGERVAFLGSLSWPPNAQAARFLTLEVLPLLRRLVPEVTVRIGGKGLDGVSRRRIEEAGAEVAGYVEDSSNFLRSASVAVVPVLSGSGICIKVLDAMKAGVPIVTTPTGARGLPVQDGSEVLMATGAAAFAEAVAKLLNDAGLRRRLVSNARKYLVRHHSRQVLIPCYREVAQAGIAAGQRDDAPGRARLRPDR